MLKKIPCQVFLLTLFLAFTPNLLKSNNTCYEVCSINSSQSTTVCPEDLQIDTDSNNHSTILNSAETSDYQEGKLYIKIKEHSTVRLGYDAQDPSSRQRILNPLIEEFGIYLIEKSFKSLPEMHKYYRLHFRQKDKPEALIAALQEFSFIEFAERVPLYKKFYTPNDLHPDQWNLRKVEAEGAWDLSLGNKDVWVAMVDDAVLTTHEDLAANIWRNDNEIADNGIDDDGNGYIDDVMGWDSGDNDNDPNPPNTGDDSFSHGTHCAGILSAATDNGLAIAAMGFNVTIIPVKTADDATASLVGAIEGVEYAIAAGAHVISMSWGGGPEAQTDQDLFDL
ncbi:MAG: S8 family serine peptidase, partial [Chitinophagales bacterium]